MVIVSLYNFIDVGLRMTVFKQAQDPWITPSAVEPSTTTLDKNGNPITTTVQTAEERAARKTEIAAENTQRLVADRQRRLSTNIAVFIVGFGLLTPTGIRLDRLGRSIEGRPPTPEEGQQLQYLSERVKKLSRVNFIFVAIAIVTMVTAKLFL